MRRLAHSAGRHGRGARNGTPRRGPRRRESETCLRGYATVFHCGVADICELGLCELGDSEPTWGTHHLQEALILRPCRQCCGLPLPQSASASAVRRRSRQRRASRSRGRSPEQASEQNAIEARCIRWCVPMTARSTSVGAVLLRAVLPQLAVVLLSLSFKSCGCDLTAVPIARMPVVVDGPKT